MKTLLKAIGLALGIVAPTLAAGPAGSFILNVSTSAASPAFNVASGTVTGPFTIGASGGIQMQNLAGNQCMQTTGDGHISTSGTSCGGAGGNSIQNQNTLQSGATFYVSSGTVQGQFVIQSLPAASNPSTGTLTMNESNSAFGTDTIADVNTTTTGNLLISYSSSTTASSSNIKLTNGSSYLGHFHDVVMDGGIAFSGNDILFPSSVSNYVGLTGPVSTASTNPIWNLPNVDAAGIMQSNGSLGLSISNTISASSLTITNSGGLGISGAGNGQVTLTISGSTYTVVASSVVPTVSQYAIWTSTTGTLGSATIPTGTGDPGGNPGQLQYQINATTFGGVPDTSVTSSSVTFLPSYAVQFDTMAIQTTGGVGGQINIYNSGNNNRQFGFYTDAGAYMGELYLLSNGEEILDDETLGPLDLQTGGTTRLAISYAGQTQVLSSMTVTGNISQSGTTNLPNSGSNIGASFMEGQSSTSTGVNFAYAIEGNAFNTESSSGSLGYLYGAEFITTNDSTNTWLNSAAVYTQATNSSTGTVTNSYGIYGTSSNQGTGVITNSFDSYFQDTLTTGSTTTIRYGSYIDNPSLSGGSKIGTNYGLYIATQTAGSNNYGIYSGGPDVFLGTATFHNNVYFNTGNVPPNSQALCLLGGQLGHCTSVVGAGGGCTCVAP